jgi:hypothetical protein
MNFGLLLKILSHLSIIADIVKDGEAAIKDLVAKDWKDAGSEGLLALNDLLALITDGVITIPGVDQSQVTAILQSVIAGATNAPPASTAPPTP